eukprot:CAMPEP_0197666034 /NCGR_PEP_ID=MMETSP1338-20131121/61299_1 /TAXON_ID=43686 ORGANISM="Pelagodinium beii, Strain RCC1491" /NCGR_SAMPLE_ID=MMETSP1338 /ASSEMBLY_ACC=CAM_ASM_000754 /LENGTH=104 /DNA_ID=CAMNT_0043244991 /DNA_START=22 /DNA_END=336 /DNA_ORIENTATION=+
MDSGVRHFHGSTLYDGMKSVMVDVGGQMVEVEIDPLEGPKIRKVDGSPPGPNDFMKLPRPGRSHLDMSGPNGLNKAWLHYTSTEREISVHQAAKINKVRMAAST